MNRLRQRLEKVEAERSPDLTPFRFVLLNEGDPEPPDEPGLKKVVFVSTGVPRDPDSVCVGAAA